MIFYFSATGNSEWVAKRLGESLKEETISINREMCATGNTFSYKLSDYERIGFAFPVHSWGVPTLVLDFIKRIRIDGYCGQPIFAVCTCGDDAGHTDDIIRKAITAKGWCFSACYAVQMPNTYILLPGFDVDSTEVANIKVNKAKETINKIAKDIVEEIADKNLYIKGSVPNLKTKIIYPLFNKFFLGKTKFFADETCISCGICQNICPTKNIKLGENKRPQWDANCVQCLACIHNCPTNSINYGKRTQNKGRYKFNGMHVF